MLNKFRNTLVVTMAFFAAAAISACSKSKDETTAPEDSEKKYGIMMQAGAWPNTTYYITSISNLKSGTIDLKGKGVNVSNTMRDQGVIHKNGIYYSFNPNNSKLGKYRVENDLLVIDREVQYAGMSSFSSHVWADDNTIVVFGTNGDQSKINYSIINATTLSATNGSLALPASPDATFSKFGVGFAEYRAGKIYLGYGHLGTWPNPAYAKVLVAAISYPTMAINKVSEDSKSKWPGGPTIFTPYSFKDENNDIYFTTVPEGGWDYDAGSLVYRIKNGSDDIDATYSFDFSSKSNGHSIQALWYLGNGQAIARVRIPADRSKPDFYYKWDSYFSVINVRTGTVIKKLDLPTDNGDIYIQAVVVEDGKGYIMLNAGNGASAIWEYDPTTAALSKGATFGAGYDFLLRLDKWK